MDPLLYFLTVHVRSDDLSPVSFYLYINQLLTKRLALVPKHDFTLLLLGDCKNVEMERYGSMLL